jgi:hypothetical protein
MFKMRNARRIVLKTSVLCTAFACAFWVLFEGLAIQFQLSEAGEAATRRPTGQAQLLAVEPVPSNGENCELTLASVEPTLLAKTWQNGAAASSAENNPVNLERSPIRIIRDMDPIYSSVTIDTNSNEVLLYDANFFGIKIFNRLENTPPSAKASVPKREIGGGSISWPNKTGMQFNNGLYVDPKTGEIYSAEADTGDSIAVFSRGAQGDVEPVRVIETPHRAYAMAANEEKNELYLAVQYPPSVLVYRKTASGTEKPLRILEGPKTGLMDIQGIALDVKNNLMFVSNYGNYSNFNIPGSGKFYPPSITVHALDASGDTPPLRVIQGPKTQLNWPAQLSHDSTRGELYVANNVGSSLLVFHGSDQGDIAPTRVVKGPKTGLKNPTGVYADIRNREVWVSNMGNASARVFPLDAKGDVAPLRTIRSAPEGKVGLKFSKPGAVAYDSKREEVLAPN